LLFWQHRRSFVNNLRLWSRILISIVSRPEIWIFTCFILIECSLLIKLHCHGTWRQKYSHV
jgi:hypothetical protein